MCFAVLFERQDLQQIDFETPHKPTDEQIYNVQGHDFSFLETRLKMYWFYSVILAPGFTHFLFFAKHVQKPLVL